MYFGDYFAELMYGVEKSMAIEKNRIALSLFLSPLTILEFQVSAAEEYGKVRDELERKGVLPNGKTCGGRLDARVGRMEVNLAFCKIFFGCISYNG